QIIGRGVANVLDDRGVDIPEIDEAAGQGLGLGNRDDSNNRKKNCSHRSPPQSPWPGRPDQLVIAGLDLARPGNPSLQKKQFVFGWMAGSSLVKPGHDYRDFGATYPPLVYPVRERPG